VSEVPVRALPGFAEPEPRWERQGARDVERVRRALGGLVRAAYHVGATSVPGLPALPVLDLVAETENLERLAAMRLRLLAYGFDGADSPLDGCRLYVVDDFITGERRVELRCYPPGHEEAERIPALFALLRARPDLAAAYHAAKLVAWRANGSDEAAYRAAKRAWAERVVDEALAFWRFGGRASRP